MTDREWAALRPGSKLENMSGTLWVVLTVHGDAVSLQTLRGKRFELRRDAAKRWRPACV